MRLVCLHADTVDALKRLGIRFDDLTPNGLWSSQYHLLGLTPEQMDALEVFQVEVEDVTPAQLAQVPGRDAQATAAAPTHGAVAGALGVPQAAQSLAAAAPASVTADQGARETGRGVAMGESEVPLANGRDSRADTKPDTKSAAAAGPMGQAASSPGAATQATGGQAGAAQKNAGKGGGAPGGVAQPQAGRKGQPQPSGQGSGQRYGTTRLRISVAGKYTEATVANGKIVVGGRTFDSPDQAAAELTKSRGDWTFWEYYDSADGKWRMLTRDWDTVLKSAAPGGR